MTLTALASAMRTHRPAKPGFAWRSLTDLLGNANEKEGTHGGTMGSPMMRR